MILALLSGVDLAAVKALQTGGASAGEIVDELVRRLGS